MDYLYLLATLLFVFGIKRLTSVKTCASGNRLSELGMAVAIVTTILIYRDDINWVTIVAGVVAESYWALAIPVAALVLFVLGLVFWVGWTILTVHVEPEADQVLPDAQDE